MIRVESWPQERQDAFKRDHDLAQPKAWALMDGILVYEFYDTEQQAKDALDELKLDEGIATQFGYWVEAMCTQYHVEFGRIKRIIKEHI